MYKYGSILSTINILLSPFWPHLHGSCCLSQRRSGQTLSFSFSPSPLGLSFWTTFSNRPRALSPHNPPATIPRAIIALYLHTIVQTIPALTSALISRGSLLFFSPSLSIPPKNPTCACWLQNSCCLFGPDVETISRSFCDRTLSSSFAYCELIRGLLRLVLRICFSPCYSDILSRPSCAR